VKHLLLFLIPFSAFGQYEICDEPISIQASHITQQGVTYTWSVNTGYVTDDGLWTISEAGSYVITLTAIAGGCEVTDKQIVRIDSCSEWTFYAPNALVPEGTNETWKPTGYNINITNILIFNRWGLFVWEGIGAWDGMASNGDECEGVFVWQCYFDTSDGKQFRQGSVTVVR
jgi:hypothetical protein